MTLWRGQIRFTVPMLFCLAWFFNFLIGGLSGVFLSDVPSDVTTHGSFFSMAHFHYTIMGGLVFTFFAAIYYWVPKMTGFELNERLGKIHFWIDVHRVQLDVRAALRDRLPRPAAPRRSRTRRTCSSSTTGSRSRRSCSALSMLVFLYNFVYSLVFARVPAPANPWGSLSLEWQLPSPVPVHNFDRIPVITGDPYDYGERRRRPVPARRPAGGVVMSELAAARTDYERRRGRAAGAARAEPQLGRPSARERDRVLLPRLRLRLLLSPLAEQRRTCGSRRTSTRRSRSGRS